MLLLRHLDSAREACQVGRCVLVEAVVNTAVLIVLQLRYPPVSLFNNWEGSGKKGIVLILA